MELKGTSAVITGAGNGIGKAIALARQAPRYEGDEEYDVMQIIGKMAQRDDTQS